MELRGKLIVLDGADGAGKSTQITRAASFLSDRGYSVLVTKEPGSSHIPVCTEFRKLALHTEGLTSYERELIFMADAAVHARHLSQWLQSYDYVICDRGWWSHVVYQTATHKIGKMTKSEYETVSKLVPTFVVSPDYSIIFDVNFEVATKRMVNRGGQDLIEKLGPEFLKTVNIEYKAIKPGHRVLFINANQTPDEVTNDLKKVLNKIVRRKKRS